MHYLNIFSSSDFKNTTSRTCCVFCSAGLFYTMFPQKKTGHTELICTKAASNRRMLRTDIIPKRQLSLFFACLCAALCFLLSTPEYTGIDKGLVIRSQAELGTWGAKFYPAFSSETGKDNTPHLVAHLTERYKVELSLAEMLATWADDHEHGSMILAIMAVESTFRPHVVGPGGRGLGQINPVHLDQDEIRDARRAGRPTLIDACGIQSEQDLYCPERNFCATGTLYGSFLKRRGTAERALFDYVGSRGRAGEVYARKVMRAHAEIAEAIR